MQAGLTPTADAWSATVAVMLAYQGFHVVLLFIVAGFVIARSWLGKLDCLYRAPLDNGALIWHYTVLQGVAIAAALHLVPIWMN